MKQKLWLVLFIVIAWSMNVLAANTIKLEAESGSVDSKAKINGTSVALNDGTWHIDFEIKKSKYYDFYIYANSSGQFKQNHFVIDNNSITFTTECSQNELMKIVETVKMTEGKHSIQINSFWGYINIDYILLEEVDAPAQLNPTKKLCTPNPTEHAVSMYQFLLDNYGKKIISGVMTLNEFDDSNWLKSQTGKEPALLGIDFLFCNQGYTWYDDETPRRNGLEWYNRNGIPAYCWHWLDPLRKSDGFYAPGKGTPSTDFDISCINNPNSEGYKAMMSDIDYVSEQFLWLQERGVAAIWRPLHEAAGGWFWWGAGSAADCKKLYQTMFDRMVNVNGVHNLIWVWTYQSQEDAEWYPGDEYVDIIGRDIYKDGDHTSQIFEFKATDAVFNSSKIVTLSECGSFPSPESLVNDGAAWSWFMPWYGDYVEDGVYNSLDLWKETMDHEYVITLDEMPDIKKYGAADDDATLSLIKTSVGVLSPKFDANTLKYSLELNSTDDLPIIEAEATSSNASITITQATKDNPTATIVVESVDKSQTLTYSIDLEFYTSEPTTLNLSAPFTQIVVNEVLNIDAEVFDQKGRRMKTDVQWRVSGGGTIKNGVFTSNGKAGNYVVTASVGSLSQKYNIEVVAGIFFAKPVADNWIAFNAWYANLDLKNSTDALALTNMQWGYGEAWLINIGDQVDLVDGKDYTITFEFKNVAKNNVVNLTTGFESNYQVQQKVTAYHSTTGKVETSATADFVEYSIDITSNITGKSNLFFFLSWGDDPASNNAKPKEAVTVEIRNVMITPKVTVVDNPLATQNILLTKGWNLVSCNVEADDMSVETLLPLASVVKTDCEYFNQSQTALNSISTLSAGVAYLIYVDDNTELNLEGRQYEPQTVKLDKGWNLLAYPFAENKSVAEALKSIANKVEVVKDLSNDYPTGDLKDFEAGKAYFIKLSDSCEFVW